MIFLVVMPRCIWTKSSQWYCRREYDAVNDCFDPDEPNTVDDIADVSMQSRLVCLPDCFCLPRCWGGAICSGLNASTILGSHIQHFSVLICQYTAWGVISSQQKTVHSLLTMGYWFRVLHSCISPKNLRKESKMVRKWGDLGLSLQATSQELARLNALWWFRICLSSYFKVQCLFLFGGFSLAGAVFSFWFPVCLSCTY